MSNQLEQLRADTAGTNEICKPAFFRLADDVDNARFTSILASGHIFLYDELHDQLTELVRSEHPKTRMTPELY